MANISIRVDGFQNVEKKLTNIGNITTDDMQTLVQQAAAHLVGRAKNIVPVRTGRLMGSIQVQQFTKTRTGAIAKISPNTNYESYVEYGTSKMSARPYMRPAALDTEFWIGARVRGIVK